MRERIYGKRTNGEPMPPHWRPAPLGKRATKTDKPKSERVEQHLSSVYQVENGESPRFLRKLFVSLAHPFTTLAALRHIIGIPVVHIDVANSEKSKTAWIFDPHRSWRMSGFVSSYIELPSSLYLYWQGTAKQNLRTRTTQAKVAGHSVRSVDPSEISAVVSQVTTDSGWGIREKERNLHEISEALDNAICVAVFDSSERAVAFCFGAQAGNAVRNLRAFTSQKGTVRWLCFSGYVEEASARGARFVIESPPWAFTGGNRIFAGHLGFVPTLVRSN